MLGDHSVFSWFAMKNIYLKCNRFRLEGRAENYLATTRRANKELAAKALAEYGRWGVHVLVGCF